MPKGRIDGPVFVIAAVVALLLVGYIGYSLQQEHALQHALSVGDDAGAARLLARGVYAGRKRELQRICDAAFHNNRPRTVEVLLRKGIIPQDFGTPAIVTAPVRCPD